MARSNLWLRLGLAGFFLLVISVVWLTNNALTARFTETIRNRSELRLVLYGGNVIAELQRNAVVPELLGRDPALISALETLDYSRSSARLISFVEEIGAASLLMLDLEGRVVAATNRNRIGASYRAAPFFIDALRSETTMFSALPRDDRPGFGFYYSRRIEDSQGRPIGAIAVEVDLAKFEQSWARIADAVLVTNAEGSIILSSEPRWRGRKEEDALLTMDASTAIERALRSTADWAAFPTPDGYLDNQAMLRSESRLPHRGWRIISFTPYTSVREQVNGVIALEIMGFAMLLALILYLVNRNAISRMRAARKESNELRALNARLNREISERQKMQAELAVAEASLAQTSKLAALGEMSAAVSHELNQPLAAMRTYLAGAKLLIGRSRPEEALLSFQRIDHLIERMGAITRQLKGFARKGEDELGLVDVGEALNQSLAMMEAQLREHGVRLDRILPDEAVIVLADQLRLEQVIINLLRNAVDATKNEQIPVIEVMLTAGDRGRLVVRDNGHGINDLEQLFEPFYTTKPSGEGVGLGLAISSGILQDFGGRLRARNREDGGAEFEIDLPLATLHEEGGDIGESTAYVAE